MFEEFVHKYSQNKIIAHVHIPKTAGTSVNQLFRSNPRFYNAEHSSWDNPGKIMGVVKVHSPVDGVVNHWPCYQSFLGADCFTFAITRNIFDWLVSYYYHRGKRKFVFGPTHLGWQGVRDIYNFSTFNDFVLAYLQAETWHFPPFLRSPLGQVVDEQHKLKCDTIIFSETMMNSLPILAKALNRKKEIHLRHLNKSNRAPDYRTFYTDALVEKIFNRFPHFFSLTNYGFENTFVSQSTPLAITKDKIFFENT